MQSGERHRLFDAGHDEHQLVEQHHIHLQHRLRVGQQDEARYHVPAGRNVERFLQRRRRLYKYAVSLIIILIIIIIRGQFIKRRK